MPETVSTQPGVQGTNPDMLRVSEKPFEVCIIVDWKTGGSLRVRLGKRSEEVGTDFL